MACQHNTRAQPLSCRKCYLPGTSVASCLKMKNVEPQNSVLQFYC